VCLAGSMFPTPRERGFKYTDVVSHLLGQPFHRRMVRESPRSGRSTCLAQSLPTTVIGPAIAMFLYRPF
jgi:hypothetical protein